MTFPIIFRKFQLQESLHAKRKHFRFLVREQIKQLTQEEFSNLCISCLHEDHYPLFEEWFKALQIQVLHLNNLKSKKSDIKYWTYLANSHRKTLTVRLTELGDTGYSPAVLEWLIIHQHWNPNYETNTNGKKVSRK